MANVGGEEDPGYVGAVGHELADGHEGRGIVGLYHAPDVDVALQYAIHVSTLLETCL